MNPSINTDVLLLAVDCKGAMAAILATTLEARKFIGTYYLLGDME